MKKHGKKCAYKAPVRKRLAEGGTAFNGPQRAVDAMVGGRDANEDRRRKGPEYAMSDTRDQSGKLKVNRTAGEKVSGAINKLFADKSKRR